jgi:CRISPR-associated endoribonuclease Cas6
MRLELNLYNFENSILEYNYNEALRQLILMKIKNIDPKVAQVYHDDPHNAFNFSSILGRVHSTRNGLVLKRGNLYISSSSKEFIFTLLKSFLKDPIIKLNLKNNPKFAVTNMRILDSIHYKPSMKFTTISPIILKNRYNVYLGITKDSSSDEVTKWINTLQYSIKSRYHFFTNKNVDNITIIPEQPSFKTKLIKIKDRTYICSEGKLNIATDENTISFINDYGLGMKTKFGFGCIEEVN